MERRHYCRKFQSINDFILRNWGACVDTVFEHVSFDTHLELLGYRSADGAVGDESGGELPIKVVADGKQPDMTESRSGDIFVPMINDGVCR